MSFSFESISRSTSLALEKQATALALLQEKVSTGSKINRASDEPSDANRVMALNSNIQKLDNYVQEMDELNDTLNLASNLLSAVSDQVTDFRADLTSALSMGDDRKAATAAGVNDLLEALLSLANTKNKEQHIFGGADSASSPYTVEQKNGEISRVVYQGSYTERKAEVAPNVEISTVFVGDKMFREDNRQAPVFISNPTGAAVGTGTSSVEGYFEMEVTKSGANYELSIDGGLSKVTVPAGGETNTAVTDSRTGKVLYVDTTGLTDTGTVNVNVPGTHDIFNLLINIRNLLRSPSPTDVKDELKATADALSTVQSKISTGFSVIGGRASTLGIMKDGYENVKFNSKEEISRLQDADVAQIAVDITRRETLYQMSMGVASKLLSTSLMDFLR